MRRRKAAEGTIRAQLEQAAHELIANGITLGEAMGEWEGLLIQAGLKQRKFNVAKAAQLLGVHRNTLHNKLRARIGR